MTIDSNDRLSFIELHVLSRVVIEDFNLCNFVVVFVFEVKFFHVFSAIISINGFDDFVFVESNLLKVVLCDAFRQKKWRLEIVSKNKLNCRNCFITTLILLFPFESTQFEELFGFVFRYLAYQCPFEVRLIAFKPKSSLRIVFVDLSRFSRFKL